MLVITRRIGEEIVIGDNIRVRVVGVLGQRIRVGISAPLSVPVVRHELLPNEPEGTAKPAPRRGSGTA